MNQRSGPPGLRRVAIPQSAEQSIKFKLVNQALANIWPIRFGRADIVMVNVPRWYGFMVNADTLAGCALTFSNRYARGGPNSPKCNVAVAKGGRAMPRDSFDEALLVVPERRGYRPRRDGTAAEMSFKASAADGRLGWRRS